MRNGRSLSVVKESDSEDGGGDGHGTRGSPIATMGSRMSTLSHTSTNSSSSGGRRSRRGSLVSVEALRRVSSASSRRNSLAKSLSGLVGGGGGRPRGFTRSSSFSTRLAKHGNSGGTAGASASARLARHGSSGSSTAVAARRSSHAPKSHSQRKPSTLQATNSMRDVDAVLDHRWQSMLAQIAQVRCGKHVVYY